MVNSIQLEDSTIIREGVRDATQEQWLLDPTEAARLLKVSRSKIYELMQDDLPSIKIGSCRRILASSLRAWLEERETVL